MEKGTQQQPAFRPGDQVRVWYRIQERDRVRTAPFEGLVIRLRGAGPSKTVTVRRVTFGEGVERVFSLDSPAIDRIEVVRRGQVRRSRLYFLRLAIGKTRIGAKKGEVEVEKPPAPEAAVGIIAEKPADEPAGSSSQAPNS